MTVDPEVTKLVEELRDCPFCGGAAVWRTSKGGQAQNFDDQYRVTCGVGYCAETPYMDLRRDAASWWNRRPDPKAEESVRSGGGGSSNASRAATRDHSLAAGEAEPSAAGKLDRLMASLACVWFYGGWKAETYSEHQMQAMLEDAGWWPLAHEKALFTLLDERVPS